MKDELAFIEMIIRHEILQEFSRFVPENVRVLQASWKAEIERIKSAWKSYVFAEGDLQPISVRGH